MFFVLLGNNDDNGITFVASLASVVHQTVFLSFDIYRSHRFTFQGTKLLNSNEKYTKQSKNFQALKNLISFKPNSAV